MAMAMSIYRTLCVLVFLKISLLEMFSELAIPLMIPCTLMENLYGSIAWFDLIVINKTSIASTKSIDAMGSPCLAPRPSSISLSKFPAWFMWL